MSYSLIVLDQNIVLSWSYPFTGGIVVSDINDIIPTVDYRTLTLPPANLVSNGTTLLINNTGLKDFSLLNNTGNPEINKIAPGDIIQIYLTDNSTQGGEWEMIPFGGGVSSIASLSFTSNNDSVNIVPGAVNSSASVDFQLSTSLQNLNLLTGSNSFGFLTIIGDNPLRWKTNSLVAGNNISINNSDGIAGLPIIALQSSLTGLTNISVGDITLTGNSILSTSDISINGLIIDSSGNIAGNTDSGTARASGFFTDNNNPTDNITVNASSNNVQSVVGRNGAYTINFTSPFGDANYTPLLTLARGTETIAPFQAFIQTRTSTYMQIYTTDTLGNLVTASDGVSFVVFGN